MASPIFYISKANSILFSKRESSNYKNDENLLSFETQQDLKYKEVQYFQPSDTVTIQVKSNLSNIKAFVYKGSFLNKTINSVLKVQNLGLSITLDCEVIELEDSSNKGICFKEGNIYETYEGISIKDTYSLEGLLPEWTRTNDIIGKYITIDETSYEIVDLVFDELENTWCFEINSTELAIGEKIMTIEYDAEDYNIYEFSVPFIDYDNSELMILVSGQNDYRTFYQISEFIKVGFFNNLIEVRYKGDADKDIFYSTGITHLLRLKKLNIRPYTYEENENQKNSSDVTLLDSQTNEGNEFFLDSITFNRYRQLVLALNHSQLYIDSIKYVIDGSTSNEPLEDTNLTDLSFKVLKAKTNLNNDDFEQFMNKFKNTQFVFSDDGFIDCEGYITY